MIHTDQDRQAWHDQMKAASAEPRPDLCTVVHGKTLTRTLGKRCPWCQSVFFGYQVEGEEREPYRIDREPAEGLGMRETCGNPMCHEAEDRHQFERRLRFRADGKEAAA